MLRFLRPGGRAASAVPVYLLLQGGQSFCFTLIFTVNMIYQVTTVGLNPLQLVLVGTLLEAVYFAFEMPTGVVADSYSRRLSIVVGFFLVGVGFAIEGLVPTFTFVLISQVFWGIGATFLSGAVEAWIADEVGDAAVGHVLLRGSQIGLIASIAGTVSAVSLGLVSIQIPIVSGGMLFIVLSVVLMVLMPETWVPTARDRSHSQWRHMRTTLVRGVAMARRHTTVRMMVLISLFVGLASEAFDRLHAKFMLDRFSFPALFGTDDPVLWFGGAGLVGMLLSLAASEVWKRRNPESLSVGTPSRLLAIFAAIDVVLVLAFAFAGALWVAFAVLWARGVVHTIAGPVQGAWMNRSLEPASRATVLSIESQANAFGQIAGGPGLGWVGNAVSVRAALLGSALLLAPIVAIYSRFVTRETTDPESLPEMTPEPGD